MVYTDVYGTQACLRDSLDFEIYEESINILTEKRKEFCYEGTSYLASFNEDLKSLECGESLETTTNYWLTFPLDSCVEGLSSLKYSGNIMPLKNSFTENHLNTCVDCYRDYKGFNFSNNLKPELVFTTDHVSESHEEREFIFNIPDYNPDINVNDLDWICYGSTASDCYYNADHIEWYDDEGELMTSWLSGDDCSGIWYDRTFGLSGSALSAYPNLESVMYEDVVSELIMVSATDYNYIRTDGGFDSEFVEEIFVMDYVENDIVVDNSNELNNGEIL